MPGARIPGGQSGDEYKTGSGCVLKTNCTIVSSIWSGTVRSPIFSSRLKKKNQYVIPSKTKQNESSKIFSRNTIVSAADDGVFFYRAFWTTPGAAKCVRAKINRLRNKLGRQQGFCGWVSDRHSGDQTRGYLW